ncbi:MAG: hypothetical protein OHK0038_09950 [Flammeovirgaceae bacterium]
MFSTRFLCIFCVTFTIFSCSSNDSSQKEDAELKEIAMLKQKAQADSATLQVLNSELKAINEALDSASSLNKVFKSDVSFKKQDALSKIHTLDSLLFQSSLRMEMLEVQLKQSNSYLFENELVKGNVEDKKAQIESQRKYFANLKKEVETLRSENVNLKAIIAQKEKDLIDKDATILQIQEERKKQEERLKELLEKIAQTESKASNLSAEMDSIKKESIKQRGRLLYETGLIFKEEFDNLDKKTIEVGTGKTKKELIRQAYDYFQRALKLGYPDAQREIYILESEKKYSKHLNK